MVATDPDSHEERLEGLSNFLVPRALLRNGLESSAESSSEEARDSTFGSGDFGRTGLFPCGVV